MSHNNHPQVWLGGNNQPELREPVHIYLGSYILEGCTHLQQIPLPWALRCAVLVHIQPLGLLQVVDGGGLHDFIDDVASVWEA